MADLFLALPLWQQALIALSLCGGLLVAVVVIITALILGGALIIGVIGVRWLLDVDRWRGTHPMFTAPASGWTAERGGESKPHRAPAGGIEIVGNSVEAYDLVAHIHRHILFSSNTFGPGQRTAGVIDHIRKELKEIEAAPDDLEDWVDVIMLAIDGAWRMGATPEQIAAAIEAKQTKNEGRSWPDWRKVPIGKAIEHVRTGEKA